MIAITSVSTWPDALATLVVLAVFALIALVFGRWFQ